MKKGIIYIIMLFMLMPFIGCSSPKGENAPEATKILVPLGDPFILLHEDTYYAYGTNVEDGIEVYTSDDLLKWKRVMGKAKGGLALHKDDVWADRWFWAPEVYLVDGKFYMYYSADEHICVATSDSPLGPFVQSDKKPQLANEKCIDNSLFFDEGKPYLYFDRFNDGLNIWVAELEADLETIKESTLTKCINVSQSWEEVWPRVNEGPYVLKRNGKYYMTYSANSYESPFYGIGCATADSPTGPWTKYTNNPLFQRPQNKLAGVGHSAMFTDKAGNLRIVFHAHRDKKNIHPRAMYISSVSFVNEGGVDKMVIDHNFVTPELSVK